MIYGISPIVNAFSIAALATWIATLVFVLRHAPKDFPRKRRLAAGGQGYLKEGRPRATSAATFSC
jgi:hypothetical protein